MAIKIPGANFFKKADAKTRVFLIFTAVVAFAFVIYLAVRFLGGGAAGGGTSMANAPGSVQSIPGGQMSPEFYRAVQQASAQAAQQAQLTGGSAVATMTLVPGQPQAAAPQQGNCTVLCTDENVNVADDLNDIVKGGKLSQEEANRLIALAKSNVTEDEYAAALNQLVREGKLTPEQARKLLEVYKKQHQTSLANESGTAMDSLIKSGQLPIDVANQLLALQKSNISPAEYAAELNRLVKEGKISPAIAAQLLAQYTQQRAREVTKGSIYKLKQMAKEGAITNEVEKDLEGLENRTVPIDQYSAELDRLVAAGKLTPAAAAKILDEYKAQRAAVGAMGTLNTSLAQEETSAVNQLSDLLKNGKITPEIANELYALQQKNVSPEEYQAALDKLVKEGKISPETAAALMAEYQKLHGLRAVSKKLADLQANNASVAAYQDALKQAVKQGIITPEAAADLLKEYQTMLAAATGPGIVPTAEANIPGLEGFRAMQARVQAQQAGAGATAEGGAEQFAVAATQAQAETDQDRQQRIQQLSSAMSNQAQSLINSWQPTPMVHVEGTPPKSISGPFGSSGESSVGGGGGKFGNTFGKGPTIIKAGTILFAVLDTAVDSDYPDTPVMATIVDGKFKGAKLLGKMAISSANNGLSGNDRVSLTFSLMNMDAWTNSKGVTAYAIDPDTARTVMASDVNYHYLTRYGALFAGSFMSGYSSAITQSGATTSTGIFGTTTTTNTISPGNKLAVGLGKVGDSLTQAVQSYVNIPPTVKVNSGVGLGILFMSDVSL